ncbi:hypothetical protein BsWGS_16556 [Bradybaena similaris]
MVAPVGMRLLAMLCGWLSLAREAVASHDLVNLTTTLGVLTGTVVEDPGMPSVHVFYGVPYAAPPEGNLRFKPPEAAPGWQGTRNATVMPCSCWQVIDTSFGQSPGVDMWNPNTKMSEDCLYLNLWVPATATKKPILVWIYGGGFWSGTSTLSVYNALRLASRTDIIVASFNYRVGPLGFLYGGNQESPGNVGLLDQVMALQWLNDNAVNMGGDPAKITIFGESAGAVSVGYHLMSPLSKDLFTYAILMSASPTAHWAIQSNDLALNRTHNLACLLGCRARDMPGTMEFLRSMRAEQITDIQWNFTKFYFDTPFAPVVDGHFLPSHPTVLMAEGKVKNTSIISGVVKDEGTFWLMYGFQSIYGSADTTPMSSSQFAKVVRDILAPLGPLYSTDLVQELTMNEYFHSLPPWSRTYLDATDDISGDTLFKCPLINFSEFYSSKVKGQVYMYSFEHRLSTITWPQWIGVAHGYEIEVFFGLPFLDHGYTDVERRLSHDVMARIANFVNTGNPNTGANTVSVTWTEYTPHDQHYLVIVADNMRVSQGLRHSQCEFWRSQIPLIQKAASGHRCVNIAARLAPRGAQLASLMSLIVAVAFTKYPHTLHIS